MRNLLTIALLFVLLPIASADITYGSLYREDARDISDRIEAYGYYCTVGVMNQDGAINIGVIFEDSYSAESSRDNQKIASAILAVGAITAETGWHSDDLLIVFGGNNYGFTIATSACRYFCRNIGSMSQYEMEDYLGRHLYEGYF